MAYIITRITKAEDAESGNVLDAFAFRSRLGDHYMTGEGWDQFAERLAKLGYEIHHPLGYRASEWPLTAVVYTSKDKSGMGRSGSSLHRLPCRRSA